MTIYLSPSSISSFFELKCPAAWKYSREWQFLEEEAIRFKQGTDAHALMEGKIEPESIEDATVLKYYDKLSEARRRLEIETIATELWQEFEIVKGVVFRRKIDLLARVKGHRMVVDWKTSGGGWKAFEGITPQVLGFQSIGYLIPPPDVEDWPKQLMYVVATAWGPVKTFTYTYNKEDHKNLLDAIQIIKQAHTAKRFPKVKGYTCGGCDYRFVCYETDGWESRYKAKDSRPYTPKA